jgi:hypothetical protein
MVQLSESQSLGKRLERVRDYAEGEITRAVLLTEVPLLLMFTSLHWVIHRWAINQSVLQFLA